MNKREIEERLITFAVLAVEIVEGMPSTRSGNHLAGQLLRSGTSPALNYGEAQGAESTRDFIHKMKVVLKELRESFICLKVIHKAGLYTDTNRIDGALKENNELIAIFVASCKTAENNKRKRT